MVLNFFLKKKETGCKISGEFSAANSVLILKKKVLRHISGENSTANCNQ